MTIINFILKKIFFSSLICLVILISFFFIFSLLGNLGENYSFSTVIILSSLSALQILFYTPLFIFFLILLIFTTFLRTHNEIIIISHYLSLKKIFFIFLIMIITFTLLEVNKTKITKSLEQFKNNYLKKDETSNIKLVISKDNSQNKIYTLINQNLKDNQIENVSIFELRDKNLYQAIYSNEIIIHNNDLISNNYFFLQGSEIIKINEIKKLLVNANKILREKGIIFYSDNIKSKSIFSSDLIISFIFIGLVLSLINLTFFKRQYLSLRSDQKTKYIKGLSFIIYSYIIINLKLIFFQNVFLFLAIFMMVFLLFKNSKYE